MRITTPPVALEDFPSTFVGYYLALFSFLDLQSKIRRGWHPGYRINMAGHPDQVVRVFCLRTHKLLLSLGLLLVLDQPEALD
jgi:hypothetical protein